LAACDVLVSVSAHEGLSLAQMEALAMGCDVVATNVGGAKELAADHPRIHLLPVDASAERFAALIEQIASIGPDLLPSGGGEEESSLLTTPSEVSPSPAPKGERGPIRDHPPGLSPNWSSRQMARRYAWLYPRVISAAKREKGEGLWLVTNNFSTGGAQS